MPTGILSQIMILHESVKILVKYRQSAISANSSVQERKPGILHIRAFFCKYCFAIVVINTSKVLHSFQRKLNLLCQQKLSCEKEKIAALRICHFLLEDSS